MTLRFLLDTNILSEPLRPQPNAGVLEGLQQHRSVIATASVVIHEILSVWLLSVASGIPKTQ
jgi:tRNA(fMet)-specific endonuclease VapC